MNAAAGRRLALIVRGLPYGRRAPRADLDLALAAAAVDFGLEIYFVGEALLQLAAERDLPDLCDVRIFGEAEWLERCERSGIALAMPVQALDPEGMRAGWRGCSRALVI